MLSGNFNEDLTSYIKENRGRLRASNKSVADLTDVGQVSNGMLSTGKMYSFRYFTDDETFYDTSPIVIGLGMSESSNQLGINLHYIPYNIRLSFIRDILRSFNGLIKREINGPNLGYPNRQRRIPYFVYEAVKHSLGLKYNLTHAVRQYKLSRIRSIRTIGYENWYIAACNDEDNFVGGTISRAQALYYKNI